MRDAVRARARKALEARARRWARKAYRRLQDRIDARWPDRDLPPVIPGPVAYDVRVVFEGGGVVELSGTCWEEEATRLTGFLAMRGRPYYAIAVRAGARARIDTTKEGSRVPGGVFVGDQSVLVFPTPVAPAADVPPKADPS